jgi:hypothetical protein
MMEKESGRKMYPAHMRDLREESGIENLGCKANGIQKNLV